MVYETIDLYSRYQKTRGKKVGGSLTVYAHGRNPENKAHLRPALLLLPGGGYQMISFREGEPVALRFFAAGYNVFRLDYAVDAPDPVPLEEGMLALRYIHDSREKYLTDGDHVCVAGFSAGGHLAGLIATLPGDPEACERLTGGENILPAAALLGYPVVTADPAFTHEGTMQTASGGDPAHRAKMSLETRVNGRSVPVFLFHTAEDAIVPVENSLLLAAAYRRAKVPFALHIFEKGYHGLSTADIEVNDDESSAGINADFAQWLPLALSFLKERGFRVFSSDPLLA